MSFDQNPRAALFDLDGTLYDGYVWQALTRHHRAHRFKLPTLYTYLALHLPLWPLMKLGLVSVRSFYHAWGANMAWLVRNVTLERAGRMWEWLVEHEIFPNLRPDMMATLAGHQKQGNRVILISGTFQPLLEAVATRLGADGAIATPLAAADGRYLGRILPPLAIGKGKVRRLENYLAGQGQGLDLASAYFYTDSIVDAPVLERVGFPVAVYPDSLLASMAVERGWEMIGAPQG